MDQLELAIVQGSTKTVRKMLVEQAWTNAHVSLAIQTNGFNIIKELFKHGLTLPHLLSLVNQQLVNPLRFVTLTPYGLQVKDLAQPNEMIWLVCMTIVGSPRVSYY